ncbi:MAG: 7TM diverse intracellular signaling domain-containing protein [Ferruginibacter sp.]
MKKRTALTRLMIIVIFLFITCRAAAQTPGTLPSIDVSMITEFIPITDKCEIYVDSNRTATPATILNKDWTPLVNFNTDQYIPSKWITKPIYLRFALENNSDTLQKIYFIAGYYIRRAEFFKVLPGQQLIPLKNKGKWEGFQPFKLNGKEKGTFIAKFFYSKRLFNKIHPELIARNYLFKYQVLKSYKDDGQPITGYVLSGIMLMMIFFTGANYIQSKKKEFLYNCCYSICMFGLIFLNTVFERKSSYVSSLFHEYLDFLLLSTGTVFYIAFTRKFLETKVNYPLLNKIFVNAEKIIIVLLAWFTFIVFFTDNFFLQKRVENGMKIMFLLVGLAYIVIALAQKNKLINYLAIGNAILIVFSMISFTLLLLHYKNNGIFTNSMIYYEVGVVGELIFFLLGLTYKNRKELIEKIKERESLKREAERQSYETKLAVLNAQQTERNRISADMHDDLGAGVTAIRLYSELAKKRIGNNVIPEIEKISSSANELLNNMNAIIWTMSSSNDTLDNMVAYIRGYALEYFENTGINCHISLEDNLPNMVVSGEIRRNVYMVIKEALNNILKHSKATDVNITLKNEVEGLTLYIQDNGTGIDFDNLRRFGNGLKNMRKRMEESQMVFTIENKNGTLITLHRRRKG